MRRLSVGFIVCIWIVAPYLLLQQFSLYEVIWLQPNALDHMVPIEPNGIYPYFLFYFFLLWAFLAAPIQRFITYLKAISLVVLISHLSFFFFPTGVSREVLAGVDMPSLYKWLISWENPRNCLPSLHASLTTLAICVLWEKGRLVRVVTIVLGCLIFWSALAIRQHLTIDLIAGIVLGIIAWLLCHKTKQPS